MKIAVCFWGLTRSLKYTIDSIHQQLDAMRKFGEVTTFMHTYKLFRPYSNIHGKEKNITLDPDEYKLLGPDHFIWDDQDEIASKIDFKEYHSHPDYYKTNYETINNFIISMYSLKRVTDLMLRHHKKHKYDYVVFMRPDVEFSTVPKLTHFEAAKDDTVVTPQFGRFSTEEGVRINDRYAICTPEVAKLYGRRFLYILEYSKKKMLHSETFLQDVMTHHDIKVIYKWICFNRVRADGKVLKDCKTEY